MPAIEQSVPARSLDTSTIWNVPNQLTMARLILSIVLFALIATGHFFYGTICFCVAAGTDWMDGYYARKYGQVTVLGRILDPFVDKVIICGAFTMLCAVPLSGIDSWMAVVVLGRELLVTTLRSFLEGEGRDFSAKWSGKFKMVFQCAAVIWSLVALQYYYPELSEIPAWIARGLPVAVWLAIVSTVYSGVVYIFAAMRIHAERKA
ncbi:MAG: CDP-diacylglycerol--glycerol-3-phosphate 3-phosphatidyltransferase [Pirellulales bacterium]